MSLATHPSVTDERNELNSTWRHPAEFNSMVWAGSTAANLTQQRHTRRLGFLDISLFFTITQILSLLFSTQNHHSFTNIPQKCTSSLSLSPLRPSSPLWQHLSLSPSLLRTVSPRWSSAPPLLALARTMATTTPSGTLVSSQSASTWNPQAVY